MDTAAPPPREGEKRFRGIAVSRGIDTVSVVLQDVQKELHDQLLVIDDEYMQSRRRPLGFLPARVGIGVLGR